MYWWWWPPPSLGIDPDDARRSADPVGITAEFAGGRARSADRVQGKRFCAAWVAEGGLQSQFARSGESRIYGGAVGVPTTVRGEPGHTRVGAGKVVVALTGRRGAGIDRALVGRGVFVPLDRVTAVESASRAACPPSIDGSPHEAHLPAPQFEPRPDPRVPRPHVDPRWSHGDRRAASPRPQAPQRVGRRQMKPEGFPATVRLRKRREFLQIQGAGVKHHLRHFLVFVSTTATSSEPASARLGVTVTRKVGPSVVRNRIRRLVREVFRRKRDSFRAGCDMVWVAKQSAASVNYAEVEADMDALARRTSRPPPDPSGVTC
jgi:ribonuclease P protein component